MSLLSNPTIQSTFNELNGNSFNLLLGFGTYSSSNTTYYYVMDIGNNKVYILNDEWKFISLKTFSNTFYMISIGKGLYMTVDKKVWKVDQDLNILINYNPGGDPGYRGISYNPSNGLIYVVAYFLDEIQLFNLNLTLIGRFSTSPHTPFSITVSSNQLYVGTLEGIVIVYQNEIIINHFNGCDGNSTALSSLLLDQNGYMATTCYYPSNKLYLYSQNGSFTGKSLTTPNNPFCIGFDSKGRLIQISSQQISIYN